MEHSVYLPNGLAVSHSHTPGALLFSNGTQLLSFPQDSQSDEIPLLTLYVLQRNLTYSFVLSLETTGLKIGYAQPGSV